MQVLVNDEHGQLRLAGAPRWRQSLVRLQASRLDGELARGARPESDLMLAVRAMQLVSPRTRALLSASIRRADLAGRPRIVPLPNRMVLADVPDSLAELGDALLAAGPVPVRGVAMVTQLLADGTGPLYRPRRADELAAVIRQAIQALTLSGHNVTYP
jgi:hypothetical protein